MWLWMNMGIADMIPESEQGNEWADLRKTVIQVIKPSLGFVTWDQDKNSLK